MKNFILLTIIILIINWRFLNFWLLIIPLQLSISFAPFISSSSLLLFSLSSYSSFSLLLVWCFGPFSGCGAPFARLWDNWVFTRWGF